MEVNMTVIQHLQPSFQFNHAEVFVDNLERLLDRAEDNAFLAWSNPLMVMVLTLDVLFKLRGNHGSLSLRINSACDKIKDIFYKIYENYYEPESVKI